MAQKRPADLKRRRLKLREKKESLIEKYPKRHYTQDMCLAKRRNTNGKIKYCKNSALDNGRCRLHGKGGAPIKHGMYSNHLSEIYSDRYEEFRNDPNILELKDEIALMRVSMVHIHDIIDMLHKRRKKKDAISDNVLEKEIEYMERFSDVIEKIGRMVEKARKAGEGLLNIESLHQCMTQIAYLININIGMCPHCHKSLDNMKKDLFETFNKEITVPAVEVK